MLTIRLQRTGTKNKPTFRIVLAQSYHAASKQALEVLGSYNPKSKVLGIKNKERLMYWVSKNVSISPTVRNLLIEKKVIEGKKVKAWQPKQTEKPAEVAAPIAEAAKAPVAPVAAPAEAPVVEVKV
ncbi:MAG: 30S ribosomal protein S16 [Candidatus Doudnabacteria bacterium RIFCSPHIGHO2_01_FULL_45_18]|uniref:30S ribosomal protein S16 n=1 Tax=Candidatus Doudnabacteria bacterium RIFCSPHIGHO2_01_FULL_45_18 TaxID=1817823 RepID=A0A1F5NPV8_9BACT|nr:MAG: 30S ribosomal protein S16 [Candidatus Doudnabacteria bacterium RIFCSPHIGHO2_01_FULL_45_18]